MITRQILIFFSLIILLTQTGCDALKPKKVNAKDFPPDPRQRVKKNIEEGRGFRVFDGKSGGTTYEFASSNPLWKATLDTLDFMPLVSANYSGGIVITDWYSENNTPNESVKITIRFLTNEIRSDAINVIIHKKICDDKNNCKVSKIENNLNSEIRFAILKKAAQIKKQDLASKKEDNPEDYKLPKNF